jgi:hypothetical protein
MLSRCSATQLSSASRSCARRCSSQKAQEGLRLVVGVGGEAQCIQRVQGCSVAINFKWPQVNANRRSTGVSDIVQPVHHPPVAA